MDKDMSTGKQVRTRLAPSPTGYIHIGSIYQAMFDYVLVKKYGGQFIVRVEDTDRNRFVEGAEAALFRGLEWFGLVPDEDPIKGGPFAPYRQSERLDIYHKYVDILLEQGHAYRCFCTKERLEQMRKDQEAKKQPSMYDKHCLLLKDDEIKSNLEEKKPFVVRMKIPENEKITVHDSLLGNVEFDSNLIDHQVILKSDGFPTYHLAAVVDDHLMEITHIIRGREWLPSTPKHVLLYRYFGWEKEMPMFIHLPLFLKSEGQGKLSKRDNVTSVEFYRAEGFLPEVILNYLSAMVWHHPEGKEIYPLADLEKSMDINSSKVIDIASQSPKFDIRKLEWMNGEYIRKMSDEELTKRLQEFLVDHPAKDRIAALVPLIKERIKKLSDFVPLTDFIFEKPEYDMEEFRKLKIEDQKKALEKVAQTLEGLAKPWKAEGFETAFRKLAEELGIKAGDMFQLVRVAISGQLVTPPLFETIEIIGEEEVLNRVRGVTSRYPNF